MTMLLDSQAYLQNSCKMCILIYNVFVAVLYIHALCTLMCQSCAGCREAVVRQIYKALAMEDPTFYKESNWKGRRERIINLGSSWCSVGFSGTSFLRNWHLHCDLHI